MSTKNQQFGDKLNFGATEAVRFTAIALAIGAFILYELHSIIYEFLLNPGSHSFSELMVVYFGFIVIAISIATIQKQIRGDTEINSFLEKLLNKGGNKGATLMYLLVGVVAPIGEEIAFRVIPYLFMILIGYIFGGVVGSFIGLSVAVVATVVWVALHGDRKFVIAPFGVFYFMLLLEGMLVEAFLVHFIANSAIFVVAVTPWFVSKKIKSMKASKSDYPGEPAPIDAPALPPAPKPSMTELLFEVQAEIEAEKKQAD